MTTFRFALAAVSCVVILCFSSSFAMGQVGQARNFDHKLQTDLSGDGFELIPSTTSQPNPFKIVEKIKECDDACLRLLTCQGYVVDLKTSMCSLASKMGAKKADSKNSITAVRAVFPKGPDGLSLPLEITTDLAAKAGKLWPTCSKDKNLKFVKIAEVKMSVEGVKKYYFKLKVRNSSGKEEALDCESV